jgi:hypothetical protein
MSSAIVTVLYLPFTGELADPLYGLGTVPGLAFFTAVGASGSVSVLVDRRLTVQRRWNVVTARITAFSVARFPLMLFGPLTESAFAIFALGCAGDALANRISAAFETSAQHAADATTHELSVGMSVVIAELRPGEEYDEVMTRAGAAIRRRGP